MQRQNGGRSEEWNITKDFFFFRGMCNEALSSVINHILVTNIHSNVSQIL